MKSTVTDCMIGSQWRPPPCTVTGTRRGCRRRGSSPTRDGAPASSTSTTPARDDAAGDRRGAVVAHGRGRRPLARRRIGARTFADGHRGDRHVGGRPSRSPGDRRGRGPLLAARRSPWPAPRRRTLDRLPRTLRHLEREGQLGRGADGDVGGRELDRVGEARHVELGLDRVQHRGAGVGDPPTTPCTCWPGRTVPAFARDTVAVGDAAAKACSPAETRTTVSPLASSTVTSSTPSAVSSSDWPSRVTSAASVVGRCTWRRGDGHGHLEAVHRRVTGVDRDVDLAVDAVHVGRDLSSSSRAGGGRRTPRSPARSAGCRRRSGSSSSAGHRTTRG